MNADATLRKRSRAVGFINDKVRLLVVLTMLPTLGGFLGGMHWLPDLTSHFRVQYLAASALFTAILLVFRDWRWSGIAAVCAVINAAVVLPWYFGGPPREVGPVATESEIRVLLSNVYTANQNAAPLLAMIWKERPDFLVLQEVDERWVANLKPLDAEFPHSRVVPRSDNFGIGIWSRRPLIEARVIEFGDDDLPEIRARIAVGKAPLTIFAAHPVPPVGAAGFSERNARLRDLAARARLTEGAALIVGDLNITMWSPNYRRLIRESGFRNSRKGFGVLPTWPTFQPLLGIPLDHCLASLHVAIRDFRVGESIGSDHLPIIVDLSVSQ